MKINFSDYDFTDFEVKDGIFCGIPAKLITPNYIGTHFNQKNKIFRSSIWSNDGELLSASFPKFTDWLINPENFPVPQNLNGANLVSKEDGSTYIVDYVNDQFSIRTRGTFDFRTQKNAPDFEYCINKYPLIKDYIYCKPNITLLFEITTPNQQIVINYGPEPDLFLIGAIYKDLDYRLERQFILDIIAKEIKVKRPKYYHYSNINDLIECITKSEGVEGICVYSDNDQVIHRLKSDWYRKLAAMKDELSSIDKMIDLWTTLDYPDYQQFYTFLLNQFNIILVNQVQGYISKICDAKKEVDNLLDYMRNFIKSLDGKTRKDQALAIQQAYGISSGKTSIAFHLLNGKELEKDHMKKLIYQCLKN